MRTAEAVRAPKTPSRATPFMGFFSATFWPAAMLTHCFMGGPKRHIQPERYVQCALTFFPEYWKNILTNELREYIVNKSNAVKSRRRN
jgi:hypothetical protein